MTELTLRTRIWGWLWLARHKLRRFVPWLYNPIYAAVRRCQGARRPPIGSYEQTQGTVHTLRIFVSFGGACPVQGEGVIDEHPVYYRSRGETWSMDFYAPGTDIEEDLPSESVFSTWHRDYIDYDGGWITAAESMRNILQATEEFRAWRVKSVDVEEQ